MYIQHFFKVLSNAGIYVTYVSFEGKEYSLKSDVYSFN